MSSWISQAKKDERRRLETLSLDELNEEIIEAIRIGNDPNATGKEIAAITKEVGRSVQFRKRRQALKALRNMSPQELEEKRFQAEQRGLNVEAELIDSVLTDGSDVRNTIRETAENKRRFKNNLQRIEKEYTTSQLYDLLTTARKNGNDRAAQLISRVLKERESNPQLRIEAERGARNAQNEVENMEYGLSAKTRRELGRQRIASPSEAARFRAENNLTNNQSGLQNLKVGKYKDKEEALLEEIDRELRKLDNPSEELIFGTSARPDISTREGWEDYRKILKNRNPNRSDKGIEYQIGAELAQGITDPIGEGLKQRDFSLYDAGYGGEAQRLIRQAPAVDAEGIQQQLVGTQGDRIERGSFKPGGKEYRAAGFKRDSTSLNNQPMLIRFENLAEVPDLNLEQQRIQLPEQEYKRLTANQPLANVSPEKRKGTITFERFTKPRLMVDQTTGQDVIAVGRKSQIVNDIQQESLFTNFQELDAEIRNIENNSSELGLVKTEESAPAFGRLLPVMKREVQNSPELIQRLDNTARVAPWNIGGQLGDNRNPTLAILQGIEEGRFTEETPLQDAINAGVQSFREANRISTSLPVEEISGTKQTVGDLLRRLNQNGEVRFERRVVNPVREEMNAYIKQVAIETKEAGLPFTRFDAEEIGREFIREKEASIPWTERDANGNWNWREQQEVRMVPVLTTGEAARKQQDQIEAQKAIAKADRFAIGELNSDDFESLLEKERRQRAAAAEPVSPVGDRTTFNVDPRAQKIGLSKFTPPQRRSRPDPLILNLGEDPNNLYEKAPDFGEFTTRDIRGIQSPSNEELAAEELRRRNALVATPENIDAIRQARSERLMALQAQRRAAAEAAILADVRGDAVENRFFSKAAPGNFIQDGGATPSLGAQSLIVSKNNSRSPYVDNQSDYSNRGVNRFERMLLPQGEESASWQQINDDSFIDAKGMSLLNKKAYAGLNPSEQNQLLTRSEPLTISSAPQAHRAVFGPLPEGSPRYVDSQGRPIETMPEKGELSKVGEWARGILDTEGSRDGIFNVGLDKVNLDGDENVEGNLVKAIDPIAATPVRAVEIGEELAELNRRFTSKGVNIGRPVQNLSDFEEALYKLEQVNNQKGGTWTIDWETNRKTKTANPSVSDLMSDLDYRGEEASFKVAQALFQRGEAQINTSPRSLITPSGQEIIKIGGIEGQAGQLQREPVFIGKGKTQKREVAGQLRKLNEEAAVKNVENYFIAEAQQLLDARGLGERLTPEAIANARVLANEYINDPDLVGRGGMQVNEASRPFIGVEAERKRRDRIAEQERLAHNRAVRNGELNSAPIYKEQQTNYAGENAFMAPEVASNVIDPKLIERFNEGRVSKEYMELLLANQEQVNSRLHLDSPMDQRNPIRTMPNPASPGVALPNDLAQLQIEGDRQFADRGASMDLLRLQQSLGKPVTDQMLSTIDSNVVDRARRQSPIRGEGILVRRTTPNDKVHFSYGRMRPEEMGGISDATPEVVARTSASPRMSIDEMLSAQQAMDNSRLQRIDPTMTGVSPMQPRSRGGAIVPFQPVAEQRPAQQTPTRDVRPMIDDPWGESTVPERTATSTNYDLIQKEVSVRNNPNKQNATIDYAKSKAAPQQASTRTRQKTENNILNTLKDVFTNPANKRMRRNIGIGAAGLGLGTLVGSSLNSGKQYEEEEDERYYR